MKNNLRAIWIFLFTIVGIQFGVYAQCELIYPEDFEYLGAFRLPNETSGATSWNGGGMGMTYYPNGDPAGPKDGYPGSLYSIGQISQSLVSEFNIPVPIISSSKDLSDLNVAETLQGFYDVTNGRQNPGKSTLTELVLSDIQYLPKQDEQMLDKLYWVMYIYYVCPSTTATLGWGELNLQEFNSQGVWSFGSFACAATSRYLFEIPKNFADANLNGRYLAAGRFRGEGSWGPALYASAPWKNGNPPLNATQIDTIELKRYGTGKDIRNIAGNDNWNDGAWLTLGNKSAVIIAGMKGFRNRVQNGMERYGFLQPDDTGYKGYHSNPDYALINLYDSRLFAEVAKGNLQPGEIQPYAYFNAHDLFFNSNKNLDISGDLAGRETSFGALGYDRERNLLYAIESRVDGHYAKKSIVHVFRLSNKSSRPDTEPPAAPTNLKVDFVNSTNIALSWSSSSDNEHVAGYIIFRNGLPIDPSVETNYVDARINPDGIYNYTVIAIDSSDLKSKPSSSIVIHTPSGSDNRIPLITNVHFTDITHNSAVVNWNTDEMATTMVKYKIEYGSSNYSLFYNSTLTREHIALLDNLPAINAIQRFEVYISSNDSSENKNEYYEMNFATSRTASDNSPPILNGIGAKIAEVGKEVEFAIEAYDSDIGDMLTFSVNNNPDGSVFNPNTKVFYWKPKSTDIGINRFTFTVNDGDQADSEEIAIIVKEASSTCDIYEIPNSFCKSGADKDFDNLISIIELLDFIGSWHSGNVQIIKVMDAVKEWKNEC